MRFLLLLALVATVFSQTLSPAPYPQDIVAQCISVEVHSRSAGSLPLRAVVKFVSPIDLVANRHTIVVQQLTQTAVIGSAYTTAGWVFFIPKLNRQFQNDTTVNPFIFGENKHEDLEDTRFAPAYEANGISTGTTISFLGAIAPRARCIVSDSGKIIICTLETPNGQIIGVNTRSTGDYRLKAAVQYEMFIPQRFLSPNPEYPKQTVPFQVGFILTSALAVTANTDLSVNFLDYEVALFDCVVPLTYNVPELTIRTLLLMSVVPDNTIQGQQLKVIVITFQLGILVIAGGYIGLEVNYNIFAQVPANGAGGHFTTQATAIIAIGYNCAGVPELCCSQSLVSTRPQGDGGVNPLVSPAPGWSQMRIRLGPKGCMLPSKKVIVITLIQDFLGKNPSISNTWTIGTTATTFQAGAALAVNMRMFTSSEPHPVNVARLGEPRHPMHNGVALTVVSAGTNTAIITVLGGSSAAALYWDVIHWTSWVVGGSVVRDFSAVPTSTVANVPPGVVRFQFTLVNVAIANLTSATVNAIIISANQGVFKPNQNSLAAPEGLVSGTLPASCVNARWYTNAYGTLIILLNPAFNVRGVSAAAQACANDLKSGTTVVVFVPEAAFLPNIAAGQWVYFDIRVVDPYLDNSLQLYELYPTGGWPGPRIFSVDTATLMMQAGWFTTIDCSSTVLSYQPNLLTNIRATSISARCDFLFWVAAISPVVGGIYQCPTAATIARTAPYMVTYVKVPEAAFSGHNWPWSYTPNTPYPNPVSIPNSAQIVISNYGWIIDTPMFAIIVSYPPTIAAITSLGLAPVVPATYSLLLVIRMDRLTESCQVLILDPWEFLVTTNGNIAMCLFFAGDGSNLAGVALEHVTWGARHFHVPGDGAVVCWITTVGSPVPGSDSDDALFGLLALIAIPVLLCYCLLALLWFCRPKREPPCCVPEYPVQEMYWVNAQQPAPVYMVEQACAPATTPIYLVQ